MCGISGYFGRFSLQELQKANTAISHRGPDSEGIFVCSQTKIGLAHRRLSIIDLNKISNQPLYSHQQRYSFVFNGEIYNYKELREYLSKYKISFNTQSDTEVLFQGLLFEGPDFLLKARGMFAFALADRGPKFGPKCPAHSKFPNSPYLMLARDRFGIKPLLYQKNERGIFFSSEIKSFINKSSEKYSLNPNSISDYLQDGTINQDKTIFSEISHLSAGSYLLVTDEGLKSEKTHYYSLAENIVDNSHLSFEESIECVKEQLTQSVRYHMVADTEVGAFLSAGIDSSAIVALMQQVSNQQVSTFTIGFQNDQANEINYAGKTAEYLNSKHKYLNLNCSDVVQALPQYINSIDQPSFDGINSYLVSQFASKDVKVCLSGLGGDEIFCGYPHFHDFQKLQTSNPLKNLSAQFVELIRPSKYTSFIRYQKNIVDTLKSVRKIDPSYLSTKGISATNQISSSYPNITSLKDLSLFEFEYYLKNTLLRDGDVTSMYHSIEVRPLLIDHVLVENCLGLNEKYKINPNINKVLFVKAIEDLLPQELFHRKKTGFEMPFATWLNQLFLEEFQQCINNKISSHIFSSSYLSVLRDRASNKCLIRDDWAWFVLIKWIGNNENHIQI